MYMRTAFAVVVIATGIGFAAHAAPVRHAGEWQTTVDGGQPRVACFPKDEVIDQAAITHIMAGMPEAKCQIDNMTTLGPVTSYAMKCTIYGGTMTSSGTITQTGFDAYTTKAHTSAMSMTVGGKTVTVPASDMTSASRRLGACKPSDEINPY